MEIVYKRESYLNDAVCFVLLSVLLSVSYFYLSDYLLNYAVLMLVLHIGMWLLIGVIFLSSYQTSLVVGDESIAEKRRGRVVWSCFWREIKEWKSTVDSEGSREITLISGGNNYILPAAITDNKSYRSEIKNTIREHCGEPVKVDGWMISDDTD